MTATTLMTPATDCNFADEGQIPEAPRGMINFNKILAWVGLDFSGLGAVMPESLEEAMHIELGTLPASYYAR
jgi:hypothetical protein